MWLPYVPQIDFVNQTTSWTRPVPEGATLRQTVSNFNDVAGQLNEWSLDVGMRENTISYPELTPLVPVTTAAPVEPELELESTAPVGTVPAAAASTAEPEQPSRGFFGRVFGGGKPKPNAPRSGPTTPGVVHSIDGGSAPQATAQPAAGTTLPVAVTSQERLHEELARVGMASAPMAERLQASISLSQLVAKLRQQGGAELAGSGVDDGTVRLAVRRPAHCAPLARIPSRPLAQPQYSALGTRCPARTHAPYPHARWR